MSITDDIRSRLDIVSFIGQYVQLKKAGRNYSARCPFHNERSPSFIVNPDRQTWHCFGSCAEGGDIFKFVMKREGLDFPSALRMLADKAGIDLKDRTPEQASAEQRLDKLRGLLEEAARFYHDKLLNWDRAQAARAYVAKRGLTQETVVQFQIGYAPDGWNALQDHLLRLGYEQGDLLAAGVSSQNDNGRTYDRFRNRLMIPIQDVRGKVVGFGARALDPADEPKYLNSPQSVVFDKSHILFALHLARPAIREAETAIIVEGYLDAIQAHQGGFRNVVAQMGTALTEPQLKQLSKFTQRLILALDADKAGQAATMRGLETIREASDETQPIWTEGNFKGFTRNGKEIIQPIMRAAGRLSVDIRVLTIPNGKDPDDLIRTDPAAFRQAVADAHPIADWVIARAVSRLSKGATLTEKEQLAREYLPILIATENKLLEQDNIQKLALSFQLPLNRVQEWVAAMTRGGPHAIMPEQRLMREVKGETRQLPPSADQHSFAAPPTGSPAAPQDAESQAASQALDEALNSKLFTTSSAAERFVLAVLLQNPGWSAFVDRRLRELAAQAKHCDAALGPLNAEDFTNTDYRLIYDGFSQALRQYAQEPIDYLRHQLAVELFAQVEILLASPWQWLEQKLSPMLTVEMERIQADRSRFAQNIGVEQELRVLERRALELRKARLKRENQDFQFWQQQDAQIDPQDRPSQDVYAQQLATNVLAIKHIDAAMRLIAQGIKGK